MSRHLEVRSGVYLDSVTLMQVSRDAAAVDGVSSALVAMATELNLELLAGMGFTAPSGAAPTDLLIAIEATDGEALATARAHIDSALTNRVAAEPAGFGDAPAPRTTASALRRSDADIALVSTPGQYAFVEAMDALEAGRSVMVFSDNVPVEQEVRLKDEAARRGLLVMGPDCGTAVVSGVGLGFANVVRPGPVGIVAASGTGAQQLMCLLDGSGVGISHCLGVGSRDMSEMVGGRSTLTAMQMMAEDEATDVIVVIGKPPGPSVAEAVAARGGELGKPVIVHLLGQGDADLTSTAEAAVVAAGRSWQEPRWWLAPEERNGRYPYIRGLFSGGTLCEEAMLIASQAVGPVHSNIPLRPEWGNLAEMRTGNAVRRYGHIMIDFGDDQFTQARPHPMIDSTLRVERMAEEARDPDCGVLLLDVVLGHGAHPDPAGDLVPAIKDARATAAADGRELAVVIALIGTAGDPQGLERQAEALRDAGASVHLSNAHAARKAVELAEEVR
jgi:FdrA protein